MAIHCVHQLLSMLEEGDTAGGERSRRDEICPSCRVVSGSISSEESGALAPPSAAPRLLLPGHRVAGRYQVLDFVGAGGMGLVYAAFDERLQRKVALKVVRHARGGAGAERSRRLLREARVLAQLSHPNLVVVHDAGEVEDGDVYVVMELVVGETLEQRLERGLELPIILHLFRAAGAGLGAAHDAGVVHRDFKAANVLVGDDGRVRVTDFGLALDLSHRSSATPIPVGGGQGPAGTPGYIAPELLLGKTADARSDQYAFCVALFKAIHPLRPEAPSSSSSASADPSRRPRPRLPGRAPSARIDAVLRRGLSPDPQRRYPSMRALVSALAAPPGQGLRPGRGAAALCLCLLLAGDRGGAGVPRGADPAIARAPRREGALEQREVLQDRFSTLSAQAGERLRWGAPQESLALAERLAGEATGPVSEVIARMRLSDAQRALGERDEAERSLRAALALTAQVADRSWELSILLRLAMHVAWDAGRPAEGQQLAQRALDLARRIDRDPAGAEALDILAVLAAQQGRTRAALGLQRQVLSLRLQQGSAESQQAVRCLNQLGALHLELGELEDAERFLLEAFRKRAAQYGGTHPRVAGVMTNLAALRTAQGRIAEARRLYERALALRERSIERPDGEIAPLLGLAQLERRARRPAAALAASERARRIAESFFGPAHPTTIEAALGHASALLAAGRRVEARAAFLRLVPLARALPQPHQYLAAVLEGLAASGEAGDSIGAEALAIRFALGE